MLNKVTCFLRGIGPVRAAGFLAVSILALTSVAMIGYLTGFSENFRLMEHGPLILRLLWLLVLPTLAVLLLVVGVPLYKWSAGRGAHSPLNYAIFGGIALLLSRAMGVAFWSNNLFTAEYWERVAQAAQSPWHILTVILGASAGFLFALSLEGVMTKSTRSSIE